MTSDVFYTGAVVFLRTRAGVLDCKGGALQYLVGFYLRHADDWASRNATFLFISTDNVLYNAQVVVRVLVQQQGSPEADEH